MDSKQEKRAFFQWQKSSDEHLFSVALLVGLFAIRNEFSGGYKLAVYLFLALLIFASGWGLVRTKILENEYLSYIRDKRYRVSKLDAVREWLIFLIYLAMGITIVYLSMNIWKEIALSALGK